jgi:hypothetical protein
VREIFPGIWAHLERKAGPAPQDEWRDEDTGGNYYYIGMKGGIRRDGTFWVWDFSGGSKFGRDLFDRHVDAGGKVQVGSGSNWRSLIHIDLHSLKRIGEGSIEEGFLLLKADGALWKWNPFEDEEHRWQQLGHHRKWVAFYPNWEGSLLLSADGSLWTWKAEPADRKIMGLPGVKLEPRELEYLGNIFDQE